MDWLRRKERPSSPAVAAPDEPVPGQVERSSPGLTALLERVSEDRSHAVLDLGPAASSSLQVYGRYARWIRFADLLATVTPVGDWEAVFADLAAPPERPYDLIFAWNVLDSIPAEKRPRLVERLVELSAPDARVFVVVDTSGSHLSNPLRFSLLDTDRMRYGPAEEARPAEGPPLLPAEVERLLHPFQVSRAFTSQVGLREYVAVRTGRR